MKTRTLFSLIHKATDVPQVISRFGSLLLYFYDGMGREPKLGGAKRKSGCEAHVTCESLALNTSSIRVGARGNCPLGMSFECKMLHATICSQGK